MEPTLQRFPALGTTCEVGVANPAAADDVIGLVAAQVAECDLTCSRFRADSELTLLNNGAGREVEVSDRLLDELEVAVRAARVTGGVVDPTIGQALIAQGYDRHFDPDQRAGGLSTSEPVRVAFLRVAGWTALRIDRARHRVRVPAGILIDLGATAKARCADLAAESAARTAGCGVLVNLGGDIAVAGAPPAGGWRVRVTDRSSDPLDAPGQTVAITDGGLATSSVTLRAWRRGDRDVHHLIDPATGAPAPVVWRTASVTAASCVDANIGSTASVVLGTRAPAWLAGHGLAARLVAGDGLVTTVGGWPDDVADHIPSTDRTSADR